MTMLADTRRPPLTWRLLTAIPVVGRIAREISHDAENALYGVIILMTVLILAAKAWGIFVFTLAALAAVPVMFAFFIWICWPFRKAD
jgi:hypothetical protein